MKLFGTPLKWILALLALGIAVTLALLARQRAHLAESVPGLPTVRPLWTEQTSTAIPPSPLPSAIEITVTSEPPTATPAPTATEVPALPDTAYITDILGHRQYFSIGCETSAAVDWAEYFGYTLNEFEFQHSLPLSDNPDLGFVGNVNSPWGQVPPYAYGVHAYPIASQLRLNGLRATGVKGWTLEEVKAELAQGQPVIAWVIGNMVGGVPYEYTDLNGGKVVVAAYEHVVILTGYDPENIRYLNNGRFYDIPNEYFLNSWGVLGNMALYWED